MKKVGVAILGLGKAGGGVYRILTQHAEFFRATQNVDVSVVSVLESDPARLAEQGVPAEKTVHNIAEIATDPEVGVVVECLGDVKEAKEFVLAALYAGKTAVISGSELFAKHAGELERTAKRHNAGLFFEGCLGGLPAVRTLLGSLRSNVVGRVVCTVDPADTEAEAAYRLSILATVAFHTEISCGEVVNENADVSAEDLDGAAALGYTVKTLAVARMTEGGAEAHVGPALVRNDHPLAAVNAPACAVLVTGDPVGDVMVCGKGPCGAASMIVSDVLYAATHAEQDDPCFICTEKAKSADCKSAYFLHLAGEPEPLSKAAALLAKNGVTADCLWERGGETGGSLFLITHETRGSVLRHAVGKLSGSGATAKCVLRVI